MTLVQYSTGAPTRIKRSDTARLQAAFPSSPALDGYDDAAVAVAMGNLHNGVVTGNPDYPSFSLDYAGVNATTKPHAAGEVPVGPGGLPWTAYVPNIASPGAGSVNPNDMPPPPAGAPRSSGMGSTKLPAASSPQTADQQKAAAAPGNLIKGRSHPQSATP